MIKNDIIKHLAVQAGAYKIFDPDHPNAEPMLRLRHIGIENFAELLISECIKVIVERSKDNPAYMDDINNIKTHFGIN